MPSEAAGLVAQVKAEAATRTGISADRWAATEVRSVTWSDGSLGCPQPGQMYTQALVPGYLIRLKAASGEIAEYHSSGTSRVIYCANPRPASGA